MRKLSLLVMCCAACVGLLAAVAAAQSVSVTTFHGGNDRLGWNNRETVLTPQNVRPATFGKLWEKPLDGHVNGSPLLVTDLKIGGKARDVVFVVTEHNSAYALDAADGAVLWSSESLIPTLSDAEFTGNWHSRERVGNLSTPVIDPATATLYLCAPRPNGLRQAFEVWALDLQTGKARPGWPVLLNVSDKGTTFAAGEVMQRGALSLVNNWLYIPFGGRGDIPPWRGWLIAVDTKNPKAAQRAVCFSPKTDGAGVWSAGGVSALGNEVFAVTGNGDFDVPRGGDNLAQSIIRLRQTKSEVTFSKGSRDHYTPANYKELDEQDEDLGGATALILPDFPESSTPRLLFTGGKDGKAYLVNRDDLGGIGGELQQARLFGLPNAEYHEGIRATAAYFDAGAAGRLLFVPGDQPGPGGNTSMVLLKLTTATPNGPARFTQVWSLKENLMRPSSPVVSSNGAHNGIVWLVEPDEENSALHAFDALTGAELYSSRNDTPTDKLVDARKFTSVTVANGRVFIGARGVYCYGLSAGEKSTP